MGRARAFDGGRRRTGVSRRVPRGGVTPRVRLGGAVVPGGSGCAPEFSFLRLASVCYVGGTMRRLFGWFVALGVCLAAVMATSAQFKMADGAVIEGELVAPNDEGTVIRRASGGLTGRIPWDRFAQETLQEFTNNPALAGF